MLLGPLLVLLGYRELNEVVPGGNVVPPPVIGEPEQPPLQNPALWIVGLIVLYIVGQKQGWW